eukprot:3809356-Amphidinium_carterae.3
MDRTRRDHCLASWAGVCKRWVCHGALSRSAHVFDLSRASADSGDVPPWLGLEACIAADQLGQWMCPGGRSMATDSNYENARVAPQYSAADATHWVQRLSQNCLGDVSCSLGNTLLPQSTLAGFDCRKLDDQMDSRGSIVLDLAAGLS